MSKEVQSFRPTWPWLVAIAGFAFGTVACMLLLGEVAARLLMPVELTGDCYIPDEHVGHRYAPNCLRTVKVAEGPRVEYRYNACGLRQLSPCGPKRAGSLRLAVIGNSFGDGGNVPLRDSMSEQISRRLAATCRPGLDLQNFSGASYALLELYERFPAALSSDPDVVLFFLMPNDLAVPISRKDFADRDDPRVIRQSPLLNPRPTGRSPIVMLRQVLTESRLGTLTLHYLYEDNGFYIRTYRLRGEASDYLRSRPPPLWQDRYRDAGVMIAELAQKSRDAGKLFVLISLPQRVQAAMLDIPGDQMEGYDPRSFSREIRSIALRAGVPYIDGFAGMSSGHHAADLYYPVDGHLNVQGHKWLGSVLSAALQQLLTDAALCGRPPPKHP